MSKTTNPDLNSPLEKTPIKLLWSIGPHVVCILDRNIVETLGIDEDNTRVEQHLTKDGNIILRIQKT